MHFSLKNAILPQPASFLKKKNYEVQEVLGVGTFGKVVVSEESCRSTHGIINKYRKQPGVYLPSRPILHSMALRQIRALSIRPSCLGNPPESWARGHLLQRRPVLQS